MTGSEVHGKKITQRKTFSMEIPFPRNYSQNDEMMGVVFTFQVKVGKKEPLIFLKPRESQCLLIATCQNTLASLGTRWLIRYLKFRPCPMSGNIKRGGRKDHKTVAFSKHEDYEVWSQVKSQELALNFPSKVEGVLSDTSEWRNSLSYHGFYLLCSKKWVLSPKAEL